MRKDGGRINTAISVSPIKNADGVVIGASTIARDITERKRVESALVVANRKLSLLNSITRHDIRNQLLALGAFLELYHDECQGDTKLQGYFERLTQVVKVIGNQIEFAKSYQELGVKSPEWYRVEEVAGRIAGAGGFGAILVSTGTGPLEVFADPLFEKVFFNLFDNAARHGDHVTRVSISFEQQNGDGILIVADDGIGVPLADKERIFERGFGRNTGLGLFLAREILGITGMGIRETGEPGKGARFEITVPKGMFRSGNAG